ncbi:MAG TPA: diphthine--ammonia ligase [Planctomycetota bacterium]|nr:diphthine--ammonia ligase [Planctomycetota bacterium]HUV38950.1 diphthine--ammonia ligase [Planctomycetota bacterium]
MSDRHADDKVVVSWSGGKDCAMVLRELLRNGTGVSALLTTITEEYDRSSMHGVRRVLVETQADALGIPLEIVTITPDADSAQYEARMRRALEKQQARGINTVAIGDIFLEDLRKYREGRLAEIGMKAVFPIWGRDTRELAHAFIDLGFRAVITCVDTQVLDGSFAGREYDRGFLADLPASVDPCGENGEFHSFVWDGPIFTCPVAFTRGESVLRDGRFQFRDLLPRAKEDG